MTDTYFDCITKLEDAMFYVKAQLRIMSDALQSPNVPDYESFSFLILRILGDVENVIKLVDRLPRNINGKKEK